MNIQNLHYTFHFDRRNSTEVFNRQASYVSVVKSYGNLQQRIDCRFYTKNIFPNNIIKKENLPRPFTFTLCIRATAFQHFKSTKLKEMVMFF